MSNVQSAFAKRVAEAHLTVKDLAWLTTIPAIRIHHHSTGISELTLAELQRVNDAISHAAAVYTIYRRALEEQAFSVGFGRLC
jgi:hypothetical protein